MYKALIPIIILAGLGYWYFSSSEPIEAPATPETESATTVTPDTYTVVPEESTFEWSGQKPLIDGYVNSGTIEITDGSITVTDTTATGTFVLDMDTLHVGLTAKKPGKEGALESHLKGQGFFDVATYPTATFTITGVSPLEEQTYTVTGNLTMKGVTEEISFPAQIYEVNDTLHAKANFEIDRTRWGITVGSGSFFENMGDNLIADEVAISLSLVAR